MGYIGQLILGLYIVWRYIGISILWLYDIYLSFILVKRYLKQYIFVKIKGILVNICGDIKFLGLKQDKMYR